MWSALSFLPLFTDEISFSPSSQITMPIHIAAVKCLLAILSSQLYQDNAQHNCTIYGDLMAGHWCVLATFMRLENIGLHISCSVWHRYLSIYPILPRISRMKK